MSNNNDGVLVTTESDGSQWVQLEDYEKLKAKMSAKEYILFRAFLELVYSLSRQFCKWYETNVRDKP